MDSLLSPPNEQRHKDNVAPLVPEPTAVTARLDGPIHDFDGWFASASMAPEAIDASAEESCPAPTVEVPIQNTAPFDCTGHPALNVPVALRDGLPVGMMLVAPHFDEATLYRAAHAFESSGDWKTR